MSNSVYCKCCAVILCVSLCSPHHQPTSPPVSLFWEELKGWHYNNKGRMECQQASERKWVEGNREMGIACTVSISDKSSQPINARISSCSAIVISNSEVHIGTAAESIHRVVLWYIEGKIQTEVLQFCFLFFYGRLKQRMWTRPEMKGKCWLCWVED